MMQRRLTPHPEPQYTRHAFTLVEMMIVIFIIGLLLAIAIPSFIASRESSRAKACVSNLTQLYSATEQYALDNHIGADVGLTQTQFQALAPYYVRTFPVCPSNGSYAPGVTVGADPTCSISGEAGHPSANGTGSYAPPTAPGSLDGAGRYYHGLP